MSQSNKKKLLDMVILFSFTVGLIDAYHNKEPFHTAFIIVLILAQIFIRKNDHIFTGDPS
jgi:hypothetical protein